MRWIFGWGRVGKDGTSGGEDVVMGGVLRMAEMRELVGEIEENWCEKSLIVCSGRVEIKKIW